MLRFIHLLLNTNTLSQARLLDAELITPMNQALKKLIMRNLVKMDGWMFNTVSRQNYITTRHPCNPILYTYLHFLAIMTVI